MHSDPDPNSLEKRLEDHISAHEKPSQDVEETQYPTPGRVWITMGCLYTTMFLVALVHLTRIPISTRSPF